MPQSLRAVGKRLRGLERRLLRLRHLVLTRIRGDTLMLALAAVTGLLTGLLAVALVDAVSTVQRVAFGATPGALTVLLVPAAGGLLVGLLLTYVAPEPGGSGMARVLSQIALHGGRFPTLLPLSGVLATSLALGTGASGGRHGPMVLVGGSTGSVLGRVFAVGDERMRTLVAAGAAGGIAASFNAPIGGMLFAIELIVGSFRIRSMQAIVVASVTASVTAQQILGDTLIYDPPAYELGDPRELLLYALLGVAAFAAAVAFVRTEVAFEQRFARLRLWPPATVALGGLLVGAVALVFPEVLGSGESLPVTRGVREPIQALLEGTLHTQRGWSGPGAALLLLGLLAAKTVATAAAVGSGSAVGTFAPLLFVGAALGGATGLLAETLVPAAGIAPGAFALTGMAAVFGSAARAPLTAVVLVFELTGDYELVLPLMLATGIAVFLADRVGPGSIYTVMLRRRGILYQEPEDIDIMQTVRVGEIMTSDPDTVPAGLPLDELREAFRRTRHHGFPVVADGQRLVGVVTLSDLERADAQGAAGLTVADVCTRHPVTVTPDDPVFRALRRMASLDVGRIPVVDPEDRGRLVGLLRRGDVVHAYHRAVTRSLGAQQRQEVSRLRDLAGVHFVELAVEEGAPAAGQPIRAVDWPQRTIVTTIRRDDEVILPHGDTVLVPGDELVVLTSPEAAGDVVALVSGSGSGSPERAGPAGTGPA